MKTKNELAKFLLLKLAHIPLMVVVGIGVFWQVGNKSLWHYPTLIGIIGVLIALAHCFGFTKAFYLRHSSGLSIIRNPGMRQQYEQLEAESWKAATLALLTFSLCVFGYVMLMKYRLIISGLIGFALAIAFGVIYRKAAKRTRELVKEVSIPLPRAVPDLNSASSKTRFYVYFVSLILFSQLSIYFFLACAFLIVVGIRTTEVLALLFVCGAGLAATPYLSGVVVMNLGLPEEVEV